MLKDNLLAVRLNALAGLAENELEVLAGWEARRRVFPAGQTLLHEGQPLKTAYVLSEGWLFSYKTMPNGSRQIVNFLVPGDIVGLPRGWMHGADRGVETITSVTATPVPLDELRSLFTRAPRLMAMLLWTSTRDEAILAEHVAGLGRRSALERTAHLFLELAARLRPMESQSHHGYACPLSQSMLADGLGLTAIHLNRVLRELRERGLMTFRSGQVAIHNLPAMAAMAGFEPGYLDPA